MNQPEQSWRFSLVSAFIFLLPLLITVKMVQIQIDPRQREGILKQDYTQAQRTITPVRGQIYDRRANLLAGNHTVYEVGIELQLVRNPETIAEVLSEVLDLNYKEVLTLASMEPSQDSVYIVVDDFVPQEKYRILSERKKQYEEGFFSSREKKLPSLRGLILQPHLVRIYPERDLGSNILGFVSLDRKNARGHFGVEEYYNDLLASKTKTILVPLDPLRVQDLPVVPDGASLVLTIDREIQRSMEKIIDAAINETGAASGTLVVMDPRTGEVLALATTPRLDLNQYWNYDKIFVKDTPFNRGVSQPYEPGSVFKVLTMAAALDSGTVTPETVFLDTGVIEVGGAIIYNWNGGAWGPQNMQGCMQHSLNVCLAWVSKTMGTSIFYPYLQKFGIGRLTGVDMADEVPGRLKIPGDSDWYESDLGTNAFGQGVSATPIQMASAIAAVANRGVLMAPHVVRSVISDGYQYNIELRVMGMPIKAETAETLSEMLARSLETESSIALVTGYRVAGKTGTAEIPTPLGYTSNATNASFVGWGPLDDPRFLVYVWLEKPQTAPWGSVVAAPVFRQAVESLVILMNIPPDEVRQQLIKK